MPTVSVIIPNYNHASYLKQRIDSVLVQTYQDFEVMILDDCSTDNSREVIEQYRNHSKVNQIIYNEKNSGGVFKQWIKGIELAKGKYIWIAESDDYAEPNFLEETVKVLERHSEIGMVFTASTTVDESGNKITTTQEIKHKSFVELEQQGNHIDKNNLPDFLIAEFIIENASSVLFRKSELTALDFKMLSQFRNTGDRFVYIGMALRSTLQYLPKFCNFMRSHQKNTTKQSFVNGNIYKDRMQVLLYYFDDVRQFSPDLKPVADLYRKDFFYFMDFCTYEENRQLLEKLQKTNLLSTVEFYLMKYYLYLFQKRKYKLRVVRSIYYRLLVWKLGS